MSLNQQTSHYQEPKSNVRNESRNHYEDVGEVNLGAFELNPYDSLERKPPVLKPFNLHNGFMPPYTKSIPKDAFPPQSLESVDSKKSCINTGCWLSVVLVIMMIISSTSLAISVLIIKGIIVTPHCSKKVSAVPTPVITKPAIVQALRGENGKETQDLLISLIKNITFAALQPGPRGPPGPKGIKGDHGSSGPAGVPGSKGERGPSGPAGPRGLNGIKGDQGIQGPQGIRGVQGFNGSKGERGLQGLRGVSGFNGSQGERGLQGLTGVLGFNGSQGVPGIPGPSGAGNLSACIYKSHTEKTSVSNTSTTNSKKTETIDRKYIGVTCSTNVAAVHELSSGTDNLNQRWYNCYCAGSVNKLIPPMSSPLKMHCNIHYWDCPKIS